MSNFKNKKRKSSSNSSWKSSAPSVPLGQKDSKKQRALLKPFGQVVQEAKEIWNKLRQKDLEKDVRDGYVTKIMDLIKGKIWEIVSRHDASRVIQTIFQYGSLEVQEIICSELKEHYLELSMSAYGHFMLKSMLRHGKEKQRNEIVDSFKNNFGKLATHVTGASVLELLFQNRSGRAFQREIISKKKYQLLAREFYGREFLLFCNDKQMDIKTYLRKNPDKKDGILGDMRKLLNKQIGKGIHHLEFSQTFLAEYFDLSNELNESMANLEDMFPSLIEGTLQLASTTPGITVMINVLTHGNAKIRKQILKQLRGRGNDVGKHPNGYLLILKIFDCVDDTVLVRKAILNDLIKAVEELILDANGCKLILHLLSPGANRYFNTRDISTLNMKSQYSKKDSDVRRKELLKPLKPALETVIKAKASELLASSSGSKVLFEYIVTNATVTDDNAGVSVEELVGGKDQLKSVKKTLKKDDGKNVQGLNKSQIRKLLALL
jgi:pumilio homology domain family member 6